MQAVQENLTSRLKIGENCEVDVDLQECAIALCRKDIKKYFEFFAWTYDPRKKPSDLPFVLYPFQEEIVMELQDAIENGYDLLIDKCRDMGITWMILTVFLYRWLFFNESFLLGSRKEELVDTIGDMDTHFERIRYMLRCLPLWLKKKCGYDDKNVGYMKIYKTGGAQLVGESMNPSFSRQGRYKAILLDELAFVEKPELIWRSCSQSSPCKIPVSTPNGRHNFFAKLRFNEDVKIRTKSVDWQMHPEKDAAWYDSQKGIMSSKDLAQEVDRSYTISAGEPFYNGFTRGSHVKKFDVNTQVDLTLGFDYGFIHADCVVMQFLPEGNIVIVDNILGDNEVIDEFAERVKMYLNKTYPGLGYGRVCYGDPAGEQSSDKSKSSSADVLRSKGFNVISIPSNSEMAGYARRKVVIEQKLSVMINGMPGLVVNDVPNNEIIIEAFEGGYRFPDPNKYGGVTEKPVDDGWYEHPMNAIEYVMVNICRPVQHTGARTRHQLGRI